MKKKFKTIDILGFYFAKALANDQYDSVLEINAFLMGTKIEKDQLPIPYLAMRKPLTKQLPWLNGLTLPDRKPSRLRKKWLENIIKNHGSEIELESFTKVEIKQILKA